VGSVSPGTSSLAQAALQDAVRISVKAARDHATKSVTDAKVALAPEYERLVETLTKVLKTALDDEVLRNQLSNRSSEVTCANHGTMVSGAGIAPDMAAPPPPAAHPFPGNLNNRPMRKNNLKDVPPGANIYIFHLPHSWSEEDLERSFSAFGTVLSSTIMRHDDGSSRGFGFVGFSDAGSANAAISGMNGTQVEGKVLTVQLKNPGRGHYNKPPY